MLQPGPIPFSIRGSSAGRPLHCGLTHPSLASGSVKALRGVILTAALLSACTQVEGPQTSERCQGFIQADAEARAAWEQARDSGASQAEIRRLRRTFGEYHDALFGSGCLVS
jgi:hypothetical protein